MWQFSLIFALYQEQLFNVISVHYDVTAKVIISFLQADLAGVEKTLTEILQNQVEMSFEGQGYIEQEI